MNAKYLQPGEALPVLTPSCDMDVRRTMPLQELIRLVERSGCASGRAPAVLIFAEEQSANTITRCPAQFIARELLPSPYIPQHLRTSYPPRVPPLSGYLGDEQERRLKNEIDNLLVDVANMFHRAEHPQSYEAARAYLAQLCRHRPLDELPAQKRQRLV